MDWLLVKAGVNWKSLFGKGYGADVDRSKLKNAKLDKSEAIAIYSSIVIIIVGVVYWLIQIRGVLEMLEMAYG